MMKEEYLTKLDLGIVEDPKIVLINLALSSHFGREVEALL